MSSLYVHGYWQQLPPPELAPYVRFFWSFSAFSSGDTFDYRLLPDGCVDLAFYLADHSLPPGRLPAVATGSLTHAAKIPLHGRIEILGARLVPGMAHCLLQAPCLEYSDASLELSDVWSGVEELYERLLETAPTTRFGVLAELIKQRISFEAPRDVRVLDAVNEIEYNPSVRIVELAHMVGLSPRQLERRFRTATGLSPKRYSRVERFQRALQVLRKHPLSPMSDAFTEEFADQSHFNREFRALAGTTPRQYLNEMSKLVANVQYSSINNP